MSDAIKIISGLDMAIFAILMILIRSIFNRFSEMESKIKELSQIHGHLKLIEYRLDDMAKSLNQITVIQVKKDA